MTPSAPPKSARAAEDGLPVHPERVDVSLGRLTRLLVRGKLAADGEKKAFALPDNSKLELAIPAGWKDELKEKSIALSPREGAPFQVVLTPVARQKPGASADTAIQMRHNVQQAADKVKPSALEPYLPVEPVTGAPGPGYYFSATDREPKPGEP